jgi:hypothetical protein
MNKWQGLALGLTIVLLLGVLAAGLQTLEFRGGTLGPGEAEQGEPGGAVLLPFPYALIERLLQLMPWIILGTLVLGILVFRRELFKQLAKQKALMALVAFLVILAMIGLRPGQAPIHEEPPPEEPQLEEGPPADFWQPGIPSFGDEDAEQRLPPTPPSWITYLAAAAVAVPVVWLAWRLGRRVTRREVIRNDDKLKELRGVLSDASDGLRAGASVEEVVIRCWARMADILAPRAGGTDPAITPREFARLLTKWGVRHEAVSQLTALFEEVRYGAKLDEPRRDRALAALAAIEEVYGSA